MAQPSDDLIPTRATLIQRLKNWDDQASWQEFFDTYWKLIYAVAVKAGLNVTEAEDVVQETMIAVAKHIPSFKYDPALGTFKAWLLNTTRWRIADQFRRRKALRGVRSFAEDTSTGTRTIEKVPDPNPPELDRVWEAEWEANLMEAAMARVKRRADPERYQMFDLYVNKNCPPEKVAETFGVPVGQVYLAKHRITEMIKEQVRLLENGMT